MPTISCFFGIAIRMYWEAGNPHHRPHFHAYYQDYAAVFAIDDLSLLGGALPERQMRYVLSWAREHRNELEENWVRLWSGRTAQQIDPLS